MSLEMCRVVYPRICDACGELDIYEFNVIEELIKNTWQKIRKKLDSAGFLCSNCEKQIELASSKKDL